MDGVGCEISARCAAIGTCSSLFACCVALHLEPEGSGAQSTKAPTLIRYCSSSELQQAIVQHTPQKRSTGFVREIQLVGAEEKYVISFMTSVKTTEHASLTVQRESGPNQRPCAFLRR